MFYKRGETKPYAYTINHNYNNLFQKQRNMKTFILKEIKMDKYEFMVFSSKNDNIRLVEDWLYDGVNDIQIIASIDETSKLTESCEYISQTLYHIKYLISECGFKEKYSKSIKTLIDNLEKDKNKNGILGIDTFSLFYHLFKDTFVYSCD